MSAYINGDMIASVQNNGNMVASVQKGFTLIEVLLALAILAIVITVIYASFSTASQSVESAEASRGDTDIARTFLARLTDDISNAYYKGAMTESIFYGKKEEVMAEDRKLRHDGIFMTTLTNWRKPDSKETDLWEIGYLYAEKPEGGGYVMMRREKRELSKDAPPLEGGVDLEITDKIEEMTLRYYDGSKWNDEWDSRNSRKLPKSVEITITLAGGKSYITQVEAGR